MIYIGIDPGKKGAFCVFDNSQKVKSHVEKWDDYNFINEMAVITNGNDTIFCCLEKVHAMPKQGVTSTFNFGQSYGYIKGVLDAFGIPYQEFTPQEWKKEFGLIGKDKKESIRVCQQLFPNINLLPTEKSRVPSDGMAEAVLICEYGRRRYNSETR